MSSRDARAQMAESVRRQLEARPSMFGPGWKEVVSFDDLTDEDEYTSDEEEFYAILDMGQTMDSRSLAREQTYQLIGLDTSMPFLKVGNTVLQGEVVNSIGDEVILGTVRNPSDPKHPSHPPHYKATHRLNFRPVTLQPRPGMSSSTGGPVSGSSNLASNGSGIGSANAAESSSTNGHGISHTRAPGSIDIDIQEDEPDEAPVDDRPIRPMTMQGPAPFGPNRGRKEEVMETMERRERDGTGRFAVQAGQSGSQAGSVSMSREGTGEGKGSKGGKGRGKAPAKANETGKARAKAKGQGKSSESARGKGKGKGKGKKQPWEEDESEDEDTPEEVYEEEEEASEDEAEGDDPAEASPLTETSILPPSLPAIATNVSGYIDGSIPFAKPHNQTQSTSSPNVVPTGNSMNAGAGSAKIEPPSAVRPPIPLPDLWTGAATSSEPLDASRPTPLTAPGTNSGEGVSMFLSGVRPEQAQAEHASGSGSGFGQGRNSSRDGNRSGAPGTEVSGAGISQSPIPPASDGAAVSGGGLVDMPEDLTVTAIGKRSVGRPPGSTKRPFFQFESEEDVRHAFTVASVPENAIFELAPPSVSMFADESSGSSAPIRLSHHQIINILEGRPIRGKGSRKGQPGRLASRKSNAALEVGRDIDAMAGLAGTGTGIPTATATATATGAETDVVGGQKDTVGKDGQEGGDEDDDNDNENDDDEGQEQVASTSAQAAPIVVPGSGDSSLVFSTVLPGDSAAAKAMSTGGGSGKGKVKEKERTKGKGKKGPAQPSSQGQERKGMKRAPLIRSEMEVDDSPSDKP